MKEKEAKLERFREITLEKRLFNKKYFWLYLVLGFVILIAGVLLFFNSQITGFVVFDTFTYTKDYNLTFQNSSVYYLDLGEGLSSLRFSGRLLGEGSAKVYLEADRTRRLVLDSREEVDDGIAIAQPGDVEVYANESDKDARKIDLALDYRKGTIYDDNDDGIETEKGIIDITVEKTMFNWLVDESRLCTVWEVYAEQDGSSTVFCRGDEQCCNLQNLSASAGQWNELLYLYKGLYDASDNNTVSAQIKYVDYNLSLENAFIELHESSTASVEADFIEKVRIFDKECIESCVFSRENSSDLALIVELDNARLELDFLTYKVEKARNVTEIPPLASKKIPDLLVYKNENISLNLSNYFEDPDSAMLNYSGLEVIGLEMVFNQDIVTFIPEINLTGVFFTFITANDSKHIAVGDIFNITVKERIEINLSEETVQQPLVLLGQPVRWTKKILLSNKTDNITLNITPEASNIIVRKIVDSIVEEVDEDNILIDYKGEKQSLAEYEIVKEVEAIEETIDALNKEKRENIVDSDRVRGINQELVQLDTRRDTLTGAVIFESEGKGIVTRFFEWIFINFDADITGAATLEDENSGIGGDVGDNGDEGDATNIIIEEEVEEVEIEYTTPGPVAEEKEFSAKRKEIIISSDIHYENILAFTKIPDSPADAINLFHINNNSREPTPIYDMQDTNGDGKIDEVYWIVPHLSNQTYEIVIRVKDAEHLDENKDVVENVFELVVMKDGNLTEPIPVDHFLRITFERFLTNVSDITIVGESNGSEDAYIEVYYYNSSELITTIDGINEYGTYRTDLLDLVGSGETFDLKIKGAAIRFDQAVDPDVTACSALTTDSTTYTLTADLTASGTCISIQGIDITFDCNHKQIAFPADTDGVEAIVVNNSEEITIKNCNIVGSSLGDRNYGLLLRNVTNATLTHINITADSGDPNTYFVFYNHSYNVSLTRGNITSDNSDADSPFLVVNSNFTRIEKVNITSAGGSELLLIHNSTFVIINESIFGATANGIDAVVISGNSMNTTLLNNSLINIGVGFTLSNISGGLIENTTIGNNSFDAAVELFIQGNAANRTSLVDQPIGNHSILPTTLLIQNSTYGILEYLGPVSSIDGSSNLYELINISNNTISVNSDSGLNASANITFFDINFRSLARPSVVRNNAICNATLNPTCFNFTSLEASTVIFNVSTFSNYSIGDRGIACGDGYDCPNFNDMMDPIDTCVDTTNNQSPNRCIANLTQCNNFLGKACSMYTTASGVVNTGICTTNAGCRNDSITSSQYGTGITGGTAPDFHDGNAKSGCEAEDVGKICNTSIGTYIIAGGSGVCDPSPSCVESMAFFLNCSKVGCDASYFKVNSVSISCDSSYAGWACDSVVDGSGFSQDGICDGMDTCRTSGHICNSSTGLEHNGCGGANCVDDDPCITTFTAGNFNESLGVCDGAACVALGSNNKIYDAPTNDLTAPYFANGSINSTIINESVYYDNQTINLSHPTWGLRFKVFAHFEQDNVNLTNLSINASATKTVVNGTLISGVEQNYTILVANTSALGVYICPNATILEHVNISCPDKVSFTYEDARDGMFDPIFPGNNLAKGTYYVGMWNGTIYEIWNVTGNAGIGENDTIPPNITIDTPINETYGRSSFEINVSTNEETSACLFSLNETANVTMDKINISHFRYLYPEFAPGSNNLTVYCNDTLGNFNNTEPLRFFFIKNSSACTNATQCDLSGPDVPFGDTIDSCLDTDSDNVPDRCYSANPYCNVTLGQSCEFYDTYESGDLAQGICTPQGCINTTIASGEVGNLITGGAIFDFHGGDEVGYCSEDTEGQICNSSVQGFDPQPEGICEASNCVVDTLISMNCDGPCTAAQISSETLVSTCGESEDGWACNTQVNGSGFYQNGTCDGSNCQFTGYLCNTTISGDIILNGCGGAGECAKQDPCDSNLTDGNFNNSYANCNSRGQCILNGQGDIYDAPADDLTAPYFANGSVNYSIINETIYFSNQTLNLSHPSLGLRAAFYVHFDRGDVNLTNVTINASDTRTFINATLFSGADSNFTLYVPNSSALGVYVCPNATELEHVNTSCPNLVGFSNEEARDGMYATAGIDRITRGTVYAEMGNMSYYKIWNITGAVGIGENDTIPPNITIVLPKNTTYARHNLSLNVSLNENTSACLYSLNGTANVSMDRIADTNFNASLTFLAPGRNNVTVSCNDTLGNFNNSAVHLFYVKYGDTCTTSGGCLIDGGAGDPYMENTDMCVDTTGNNAPDSCFINSTGCPGRIGRSCNYTDGSIASAGICTSKGGCVNYSIMSGEFGTLLPGGTAADFHGGNEVFGCGDDETGFICNDTNAQFDPVGGGICVTSICMVASDVSLNCGSACTTGDISSISMVMGCTTGGYSCDSNVDANGFGQDGICNGTGCQTNGYICNATMTGDLYSDCDSCMQRDPCDTTFTDGDFNADGGKCKKGICSTANVAPVIYDVSLSTSTDFNDTNDDLNCYVNASDPDGDQIDAYLRWFVQGVENSYTEITTTSVVASYPTNTDENVSVLVDTLSYTNTSAGQNWTCMVIVGDEDNNATSFVNASLQISGSLAAGSCGDGILDSGEECDDGNSVSSDGCSSSCTNEGSSPAAAAAADAAVAVAVAVAEVAEVQVFEAEQVAVMAEFAEVLGIEVAELALVQAEAVTEQQVEFEEAALTDDQIAAIIQQALDIEAQLALDLEIPEEVAEEIAEAVVEAEEVVALVAEVAEIAEGEVTAEGVLAGEQAAAAAAAASSVAAPGRAQESRTKVGEAIKVVAQLAKEKKAVVVKQDIPTPKEETITKEPIKENDGQTYYAQVVQETSEDKLAEKVIAKPVAKINELSEIKQTKQEKIQSLAKELGSLEKDLAKVTEKSPVILKMVKVIKEIKKENKDLTALNTQLNKLKAGSVASGEAGQTSEAAAADGSVDGGSTGLLGGVSGITGAVVLGEEGPSKIGLSENSDSMQSVISCVKSTRIPSQYSEPIRFAASRSDVTVPEGFEEIVSPFKVNCGEDSTRISLNIPGKYDEVSLIKCDGINCSTQGVELLEQLNCGSKLDEVERITDTLGENEFPLKLQGVISRITPQKNVLRSGRNKIRFINEVTLDIAATKPFSDVPHPANTKLKIMSTPMIVFFKQSDKKLNVEITMPYVSSDYTLEDNLALYYFKDNEWNYLGGEINYELQTVSYTVEDLNELLDEKGVLFAIMGTLCTSCLESTLTKVFVPTEYTDKAILLVHGFASSSKTYQEIVDDFRLTEQPYKIYVYDYLQNKTLDEVSLELAILLESKTNEFNSLSIIGHSLGGLLTQRLLYLADQENAKQDGIYSFLDKVEKAFIIGAPNLGSPFARQYDKLFNILANKASEFSLLKVDSAIINILADGIITPRVDSVEYLVMAGTADYELNLLLFQTSTSKYFNASSDGVVGVDSAQHVGEGYVPNKCEDYYELGATHTDLLHHEGSRQVIEKIITKQDASDLKAGENKYVEVVLDHCDAQTSYALVGKTVHRQKLEDPTGCSCGNGFCGAGEDETSCPSDCLNIVTADSFCSVKKPLTYLLLFIILLMLFIQGIIYFSKKYFSFIVSLISLISIVLLVGVQIGGFFLCDIKLSHTADEIQDLVWIFYYGFIFMILLARIVYSINRVWLRRILRFFTVVGATGLVGASYLLLLDKVPFIVIPLIDSLSLLAVYYALKPKSIDIKPIAKKVFRVKHWRFIIWIIIGLLILVLIVSVLPVLVDGLPRILEWLPALEWFRFDNALEYLSHVGLGFLVVAICILLSEISRRSLERYARKHPIIREHLEQPHLEPKEEVVAKVVAHHEHPIKKKIHHHAWHFTLWFVRRAPHIRIWESVERIRFRFSIPKLPHIGIIDRISRMRFKFSMPKLPRIRIGHPAARMRFRWGIRLRKIFGLYTSVNQLDREIRARLVHQRDPELKRIGSKIRNSKRFFFHTKIWLKKVFGLYHSVEEIDQEIRKRLRRNNK